MVIAFKLWSRLNYAVENKAMQTYELESQNNVVSTALQYTFIMALLLNWAQHPTGRATLELVLQMQAWRLQALHSLTQTSTD